MIGLDGWLFRGLAGLAVIIALVAGLMLAKAVFIPIFIALFLAIILHLPLAAMERAGVPRILAALTLTLTVAGLIALLAYFISGPVQTTIENYPSMVNQLQRKLAALRLSLREAQEIGEALSTVGEEVGEALDDGRDDNVEEVVVRQPGFLMNAATSFASGATTFLVTVTIAGFILAMRRPFMIIATIPHGTMRGKLRAARVWKAVESQVSHYLLVTTLINIALGIVVGLALWWLGVPMPVFWGAVVAFLNYMPFVGPAIGVLLLLAVSIVQFDTVLQMILPAATYMAINFVEANFVTPNLVGRRTNIAPLAIIVSLLVWGWMWGFAGLFLSVPILVVLKATAEKTESLAGIHRMLTPRARHPMSLR
ncbi:MULTISPECIES: AI-2E family transporter [unclassified Roseitalea]|uniref:AI-2E family transporter n=1 Tax=unclassified Roseitalea TaxID=2639107 RepID=UPI00273D7535|nr:MULTISPECIES: AI-2E family transporter [unclassified Roseitalea]